MRPSVSDTIIGGQSGSQVILPLNSVGWKRPGQGPQAGRAGGYRRDRRGGGMSAVARGRWFIIDVRKSGRVVDGSSLENWRTRKGIGGSNPSSSASLLIPPGIDETFSPDRALNSTQYLALDGRGNGELNMAFVSGTDTTIDRETKGWRIAV